MYSIEYAFYAKYVEGWGAVVNVFERYKTLNMHIALNIHSLHSTQNMHSMHSMQNMRGVGLLRRRIYVLNI